MVTASVVLYKTPIPAVSALIDKFAESTCDTRLYIVDNGPEPLPPAIASRCHYYLHRPENPGFGIAHNIAIRAAAADGARIHGVVNPDTSFGCEVIRKLVARMEADSRVVAVMPSVRGPDGRFHPLCRRVPTPISLFMRRFVPDGAVRQAIISNDTLPLEHLTEPVEVPLLSGCFLLARVDVLMRVGGFDERFFMYLEDFDLCRRMERYGALIYDPSVQIEHSYGGGSYRSPRLLWHHICSAIRYFTKWGWVFDADRKRLNNAVAERLSRVETKQSI